MVYGNTLVSLLQMENTQSQIKSKFCVRFWVAKKDQVQWNYVQHEVSFAVHSLTLSPTSHTWKWSGETSI